jgi:hypothetical protein
MHRWGPFWSTGLDQLTRPLAQAPGIHGSWQAYPLSKNHLSSHPNINIVSIYIYSNIYISILYPLFGYFNMREIVLYSINMVSIGSLSPKKNRKSSFRMCFCLILDMCGNASGWSTRLNRFSYMDYTDHHIPSGKCLHNGLERSTMPFSWVNQRTFYGNFPCRFLYIQQPAPKLCPVLGWWRFSSLGKSSVSMDHGFQFAMPNNR